MPSSDYLAIQKELGQKKTTTSSGGSDHLRAIQAELAGKKTGTVSTEPVAPTVDEIPTTPTQLPTAVRRGGDAVISAGQGVLAIPQAIIGLADIPTKGYAGKAVDWAMNKTMGTTFKKVSDWYETQKSAEQQTADKKVADAKGFVGTAKAMVENPSTIAHGILQSVPSMLGGAGIARGALKYLPKLSPIVAGAFGEGAISAGQNAEQTRQNSADGTITAGQAAVATGSGILTSLFGVMGGKVAQRLGIADVDTWLASGELAPAVKRHALRAALEGALSESAFEELPQSMQEQVASNMNNGRPWDEGVAEAGAQGAMTAIVMGGGASGVHQAIANRNPQVPVQQSAPTPVPIQAPPVVPPTPPVAPIEAPVEPTDVPFVPPVETPTTFDTPPTPTVSPEEIKVRAQMATIIGQQAFAMGKEASPMKDPQLMKLLEGVGPGEGLPILEAWHNAWHKANANAPVPGIPEAPKSKPAVKPKKIKSEKPIKPTKTTVPAKTITATMGGKTVEVRAERGKPFEIVESKPPVLGKKLTIKPVDPKVIAKKIEERVAEITARVAEGGEFRNPEQIKKDAKVEIEQEIRVVKGEDFSVREPIVTKTQVKEMMEAMGGDITFTVTEKDGNKYFSHSNEDGSKIIDIKPSALGLTDVNMKVGDTVELKKADFKTAGSTYRGYNQDGEVEAMTTGDKDKKGPASIHKFEKRTPSKIQGPRFKLYERINKIFKKYNSRVGEGYLPKGAAGVHYRTSGNIRLQGMNDLSVASHELTHRLDFINGIIESLFNSNIKTDRIFENQLTGLYSQYYPGGNKSHPLPLRLKEGYATLLQKYLEIPTTIETEYPGLVREFLKEGGKYYKPQIGELLADLESILTDFQGLAPLEQIGSRVTTGKEETGKKSNLSFMEKVYTEVADAIYPLEKLSKDVGNWARIHSSAGSIFANNVNGDRGYWAYTKDGFNKVFPFNWKTLVNKLEASDNLDRFGSFLIGRDQHYQYKELDVLENDMIFAENIVREVGVEESKTLVNPYSKKTLYQEYIEAKIAYQEQKQELDNNDFSRESATETYLSHKKEFEEETKMFDALVKADLRFLNNKDVGLVSDKEFNQLLQIQGYAPMKRVFYDELVGDEKAYKGGVSGARPSSLRSRKGSKRTIISPVHSAMKNHSEVLRKGLKQIVYNKITSIALTDLHPDLFQKQQLKMYKDPLTGSLIFPQERDANIIMGRHKGKRVAILVDGMLKKTIDEVLDYKSADLFEKFMKTPSRLFTKGTTGLYLGFTLTNFTVDQIAAWSQTKNDYVPIFSTLAQMVPALSKKTSKEAEYFQEYMVMGGERQTLAGWQDMSPKELAEKISHERKGLLRVLDGLETVVNWATFLQRNSEIVTRASEYILARKAGKSQVEALEEAGRVTASFHHMGRLGDSSMLKTWIRSVPFFSAGIQVTATAYRAGVTDGWKSRARFTAVLLAVTAAQITSMALINSGGSDEQKEQYKDEDPANFVKYLYLPHSSGTGLVKIRIPDILGEFGAIINMAVMNQVANTNYSNSEIADASTTFLPAQFKLWNPKDAIFAWMPQIIKPIVEVSANVKSFPSLRALESQGQLNKEPGQRFTAATPIFLKKIGAEFNISPMKLDALVTGYFGRTSGYFTGKPGIYNPVGSMKEKYYFSGGRRIQEYYDRKKVNDEQYSSLKNGRREFSDEEKQAIMEDRARLKAIDKMMTAYGKIPETEVDSMKSLQGSILEQITDLIK